VEVALLEQERAVSDDHIKWGKELREKRSTWRESGMWLFCSQLCWQFFYFGMSL